MPNKEDTEYKHFIFIICCPKMNTLSIFTHDFIYQRTNKDFVFPRNNYPNYSPCNASAGWIFIACRAGNQILAAAIANNNR